MLTKTLTCAVGALMVCAGSANASLFQWDWQRGDAGEYGLNDNGGHFDSVNASFDTATNQLTWTVAFTNDVTEGFTLAVNNGPNPKGHAGELALLYVDARDANDVMITAYAYNGRNSNNSWKDGNGEVGGNQAPDIIMDATMRNDWVMSTSVVDANGGRTISFTIDASDIIGHSPMYPDATDPWHGIGFDQQLGLWMHPYRTFNPTYDPQTGEITSLQTGGEGWFDGRDFTTVPTPGAAALIGIAGACGLRRRRA